jgi:hypothetical protein
VLTIGGFVAEPKIVWRPTMEGKKLPETKERDDRLLELVEEALLRRATGYEDASGKSVPPDVRAAMYWLENRCPERWKKNHRTDGSDQPEKSLTDEENSL